MPDNENIAQSTESQAQTCTHICRACVKDEPLWVRPTRCARILGRTKEEIDAAVQNAEIPFYRCGTSYKLNWKLVATYFAKMDIENMKRAQKAIAANPMSRAKVTKDIGRARANPKIRRQG